MTDTSKEPPELLPCPFCGKNTTNAQAGGRGIGFSVRGIYRCECGQKKLGDAGHEAHNPLNDLVAAMAGEGKP